MERMFYKCQSLTSIPDLDTSNVINMNGMFSNCQSLTSIPTLDTSNVTDMERMFYYCTSLICLSNIDTTSITIDQNYVFDGCTNLTIPDATTRNGLMTVAGKGTWTNPGSCA
jgi:surface protein